MEQIDGYYRPDIRTIKFHLTQKYGDNILITTTHRKENVVCFKNSGHNILSDNWYQQKRSSEQEERIRIVKTAASIILEDIRSQVYETQEYPPPNNFLQEGESIIPETLRVLTKTIILNKKREDLEKWRKRCTASSLLRGRSLLYQVCRLDWRHFFIRSMDLES
ncbi:hypothetical protein AVEN_4178-1 [Araneus ventricosus]|uniref:Uncharacterized protein n=1 Tax=Araneus ventricosus TaxID=182803 RepID=A0A4Y2FKR2_ARAVE|nr:hypothetical protein AVEN_4178-1 [Araneus ventricosus]